MCFVSSPIPSLLLMVQRNPRLAVWYHLVLSWCTMVSEVKGRGMQESKNIDYAKQHHTHHLCLLAKVMYQAKSTKRFSWLTRSASILLLKSIQIYGLCVGDCVGSFDFLGSVVRQIGQFVSYRVTRC